MPIKQCIAWDISVLYQVMATMEATDHHRLELLAVCEHLEYYLELLTLESTGPTIQAIHNHVSDLLAERAGF